MSLAALAPDATPASRRTLADALFAPIDASGLAVFRILFGLIMAWEVVRYFSHGWVDALYVAPDYYFPYQGFEFVTPWPGIGMHLHFAALGVLALMIAAGWFYRLAMALFVLGFAYVCLLDQARYLNHFYFVALLGFLMIFVPADRVWSVDAWRAGRGSDAPLPTWTRLVLLAQLEVMLIFAGLQKLDRDWLQNEPLGRWLGNSADLPLIGPFLEVDAVVTAAVWGSVALHIFGAPLLLIRSTRLWAFLGYCVFHVMNSVLWNIGIFPWITLAATTLFFDPDWPRRMLAFGRATPRATLPHTPRLVMAVAAFVGVWTAVQIALPLRYLAYPGYVSWHEQGHQFSWQMMLRSKRGAAYFVVRDPDTGRVWAVDPRDQLSRRRANFMAGRPEMIRLYANHLEEVWRAAHGVADVEVFAFTAVSLNGRPAQVLVDPTHDLTSRGYNFGHDDWIMPFDESFPPREDRWGGGRWTQAAALMAEHGFGGIEFAELRAAGR